MKKKTMAFGGLLMAVAMTGYSVAGTYAKYSSKIDLVDEARVAKWELNVFDSDSCTKVEGTENDWKCSPKNDDKLNLFADSYSVDGNGLYVKSLDGDKVVAPGTAGTYQINFGGTMEVRHKFNVKFDGTAADPVIYYSVNDGKVDETSISETQTGGLIEYRPIRYSFEFADYSSDELNGTAIPGKLIAHGENLTVEQLATELEKIYNNTDNDFGPRKLGQHLKISWKWDTRNAIGLTDATEVDKLDTYMGKNLSTWVEGSNKTNLVGNGEKFKLSVAVEQVAEDYATRDGKPFNN